MSMPKLDEYRRKRDFNKTPEPPPGDPDALAAQPGLRRPAARRRARMHWDFRLEVDGVLKSWPLPNGPSLDPKIKRMAVMTEDHPYDYRTFEGVIPKGEYGGGQVIVWDEGIYTPDEDGVTSWDDKDEGSRRMLEGIGRGKLSFTLQGKKLRGSFALVKTKYAPDSWLMIKHKDEFVTERDVLEDDALRPLRPDDPGPQGRPHARTRRRPASRRTPPPRKASFPDSKGCAPCSRRWSTRPSTAPGWLWEPKLDGIRALAYVNDGKVELRSRRGVDVTKQYPALVASLKSQQASSMVLDGEICALDEAGVPRFQLIQPRINLLRGADMARVDAEIPVVYFAFDMLYLDGYDLKAVPLRERKQLLQSRLSATNDVRLLQAHRGARPRRGGRGAGAGLRGRRGQARRLAATSPAPAASSGSR